MKLSCGQLVHATQNAAFSALEYVSGAQFIQTRSLVAFPSEDTNLPATQLVHSEQMAVFKATLKVPATQLVHSRSWVALPGAEI